MLLQAAVQGEQGGALVTGEEPKGAPGMLFLDLGAGYRGI